MTRSRAWNSTTTSAASSLAARAADFSAGQDLKMFFRELENQPFERKKAQEMANSWRWARLWSYDKPTIAMVEGFCVEQEVRSCS